MLRRYPGTSDGLFWCAGRLLAAMSAAARDGAAPTAPTCAAVRGLIRLMAMRLTLGHVEGFDHTIATFAQQLGLTSIQFHTPSDLAGRPGHWELDELIHLRERCEAAGLVVEGIENVPFRHWDKVLLGEPGREQQLEDYRTTIRNMAGAGITMLGHHFMPTYVWRTDLRARGRGGALVTAFDADRVAEGNVLAGYKLAPDRPLPGPIDAERMWDNYRVFLEAVLPVAEEVGVRLAVHPDDPPVAAGLAGSPASCPIRRDSSEPGSCPAAARPGASTCA